MPPPTLHYASKTTSGGFDPVTLSDNDDDDTDDTRSMTSSKALDATILAFNDGVIPTDSADLLDWKISRVGGLPVFPPLSTLPPTDSAKCQQCKQLMPLVAQVYCPLETSSLERVVYAFSCPRKACRGHKGSVRAWRANVIWAEALQQQQRKDKQKEEAEAKARGAGGGLGKGAAQLDLGSLIFGGLPTSSAQNSTTTTTASSTAAGAAVVASNPFSSSSFPPLASASSSVNANANPFAFPSVSTTSQPFNPFAPASQQHQHQADLNPFAPRPSVATPPLPIPSPPPIPAEENPIISTAAPLTWPTAAEVTMPQFRAEYLATGSEPVGPKPKKTSSAVKDLTHGLGSLDVKNSSAAKRVEPTYDGLDDDDDSPGSKGGREGKGSGGRRKKGAPSASTHAQDKRAGGGSSASGGQSAAVGEPGWAGETYEVQRVEGVDDMFLAFQARVDREPSQLLRYNFGGTPLPFCATSSATRLLFPSSSPSSSGTSPGTYDRSKSPRCATCHGPTTFEMQLMPNLVAILNRHVVRDSTAAAVGADSAQDQSLDWATVWIMSCLNECTSGVLGGGAGEEEAWREEHVLVEWDE